MFLQPLPWEWPYFPRYSGSYNASECSRAAKRLPFPPFMLATENHVEQVDISRNRRLKNVELLMQWQPTATDKSYIVLLSLREAETLRRTMQAKSPLLPPMLLAAHRWSHRLR